MSNILSLLLLITIIIIVFPSAVVIVTPALGPSYHSFGYKTANIRHIFGEIIIKFRLFLLI